MHVGVAAVLEAQQCRARRRRRPAGQRPVRHCDWAPGRHWPRDILAPASRRSWKNGPATSRPSARGGVTMQLGFIGLGKMGGNMVHRIHRDSDHECVAFDFSEEAVSEAEGHGATRRRVARGAGREAREAARGLDHGPGRRPDHRDRQQARRAAGRGRHDHRRRQQPLERRQGARRGARAEGDPLRGRGHQRRRLGPPGRLLHDGRRARRGGRAAVARSSTCSRRRRPRSTGRAGATSGRPAPATT